MSKRNFLVLAIFVAAFVVFSYNGVALAHTPSPPICNDAVCNIDLHDSYFELDNVTIRPPNNVTGESVTVVWENHGSFSHTVTSGMRGSPDGIFDQVLSSGDTFQLEINQSVYDQLLSLYSDGVVPYYCRFHSGMDATLTIAGEPIPEFSLPTFLLTLAIFSVLLLLVVRSRKHGGLGGFFGEQKA